VWGNYFKRYLKIRRRIALLLDALPAGDAHQRDPFEVDQRPVGRTVAPMAVALRRAVAPDLDHAAPRTSSFDCQLPQLVTNSGARVPQEDAGSWLDHPAG